MAQIKFKRQAIYKQDGEGKYMVMLSKQKQMVELARQENIRLYHNTSVIQVLYCYRSLAEQIFQTAYRLDHDLNTFRKQSDKFCYTPFKDLNSLQLRKMVENEGRKSTARVKYLRCVTMERIQQLYKDISGLNVVCDIEELKHEYKLKMDAEQTPPVNGKTANKCFQNILQKLS